MIKTYLLIFFCLISKFSFSQVNATVIKIDELKSMLKAKSDTTYVINFMATWCKPCLAEIPIFEQVAKKNLLSKFKLVYISLDAFEDLSKKLNTLIVQKNIQNKIYLLDEPAFTSWIGIVEPNWNGAIPITLIFNPEKKTKSIIRNATTYQQLSTTVAEHLN